MAFGKRSFGKFKVGNFSRGSRFGGGGGGFNRGGGGDGSSLNFGAKQMATLYNPFSMKNNTPKYPDGLCQYSIGRKTQKATEISGFGGNVLIALFPGLNNWCAALDVETDTMNDTFTVYANHYTDANHVTWEYTLGANPVIYKFAPTTTTWEAWRPVSYALKVKCTNNEDLNDGWFECIRANAHVFNDRWGLLMGSVSKKKSTDTGDLCIANAFPNPKLINDWKTTTNWSLQPSYATGQIKNIENYTFQLNHEKTDNEFIKLYPVLAGDQAVDTPYAVKCEVTGLATQLHGRKLVCLRDAAAITDTNATPERWENVTVAKSMDVILIRVHARSETKLLLHSVANQEMTVPEDSPLAVYQSVAYTYKQPLERFLEQRGKFNKTPF